MFLCARFLSLTRRSSFVSCKRDIWFSVSLAGWLALFAGAATARQKAAAEGAQTAGGAVSAGAKPGSAAAGPASAAKAKSGAPSGGETKSKAGAPAKKKPEEDASAADARAADSRAADASAVSGEKDLEEAKKLHEAGLKSGLKRANPRAPSSVSRSAVAAPPFALRNIARKKTKKTRIQRGKSFRLPVTRRAAPKAKKRLSLQAVKPPSAARLYYESGSDEAELEELYDKEINHLFLLLKKRRDPNLMLRLGSLYVEKARFIYFKLQADFEKKMSAFERGERKIKPRLNTASADVYNKKAVKIFTDFIAGSPSHPRRDEALFFLGFTAYQLGMEAEGARRFAQLEKEFPRSVKLYEARFQMAEYYFGKSDWAKADSYYKKVAQNRRGKFYFLSLYKRAWSSYKLGRTDAALAFLSRVIAEGRVKANVSDEIQGFTFVDEATDNLAFFYTYSNKKASAAPGVFYKLLGRKEAFSELRKLAWNYRDTGNISGAVFLFSHLIEVNPQAPSAFEYKHQIVQALYTAGRTKSLYRHLREWIRGYGPGGPWAEANKGNASLVRKANALIEVTLRDYALKSHQTFRRTKSEVSKQSALNFYKTYFLRFAASRFSHEMRFFYGELLFDTGAYREAAGQYESLIQKFPSSKYIQHAYLNQLLVMEKLLPPPQEMEKLTRAASAKSAPVPLPKNIKNFTSVSLRYLEKFPKQKNSSAVLYRAASFFYNFNHFDKAMIYFRRFFDAYPSSPHISNVGGILLELYNMKKDYKALESLAVRFARNKNTDKKLLDEARNILRQLAFKKAQDTALKGNFKQSARLYEEFGKKNPASPLAALAFFNAGFNYEKQKDLKKAVAAYSAVLTYKGAQFLKQRNQAQEFLPVLHERLGFYRKAADGYSAFAAAFPKHAKTAAYWYNAGVIYDAFNETAKAARAYEKHRAASRSPERHEVLYATALLFERNRRWKEAAAHFEFYVQAPLSKKTPGAGLKKVRSAFRLSQIYEKRLAQAQKAAAWRRRVVALHKRFGAGAAFAARTHFRAVQETDFAAFAAVKIPHRASPAVQKKAIDKKIALLKRLEQKLKPVIRYDDGEWIIASLTLTGRANEQTAEAIYKTPVPKGLDKNGRAQYREGIKKLISPYTQAARKSWTLALEKSASLKVYSEWIGGARKGLHRVQTAPASKGGLFSHFEPNPVAPESLNVRLWDDTGVLQSGAAGAAAGLSPKEAAPLREALQAGREADALRILSDIFNRNPRQISAPASLAYFYMQKGRFYKGRFIINRILTGGASVPKKLKAALTNNLGVMSLRTGDVRQATVQFRQAANQGSLAAKINLSAVFLTAEDYGNALPLLNSSYKPALRRWGRESGAGLKILNNYGAALAGAGKWKAALKIFDRLAQRPSPMKEAVFNRAVVLTRGFRGKREKAKAKGLVSELSLYTNSARFNRKLRKLSAAIKRP